MFYKIKSICLFRDYGEFGLISDNRNFGYRHTKNFNSDIGDKIVSQSGMIFLKHLGREAQSIKELTQKVRSEFIEIDIGTLMNDIQEFLDVLENDGFIITGSTKEECIKKDKRLSNGADETAAELADYSTTSPQFAKNTQDFLNEIFSGSPQLTNILIEITSKCNERCLHCYIPHENKLCDIEPDLFNEILNQCKEMRLLHITLSGGEPLMHKSFCNFLRKCKEENFSVNVLSNLTLLNDEIIEVMKENYLLSVQTSLYSMDPNIHDSITQKKGSFEKTYNSVLKLIESDIPIQISCPIMKQNINSYQDVINWATKYNINVVDNFIIIAKYNHSIQNLNCRLSIDEISRIIENSATNDKTILYEIEREANEKNNSSPEDIVCPICRSSVCVSEKGIVYPCAGWQDYPLGNLNEESIPNIWNNSEKVKFLRELRKKDFPKCIKCSYKDFCSMCMVRNANENPKGNPLVVNDFFCNVAKIKKQTYLNLKSKV